MATTVLPLIVLNLVFLITWVPGTLAGGAYSDLHPTSPEKSVIANLFEWRFDDIADECEQFLGPSGYAAVQTSPVFECAVISAPWYEPAAIRPWYERYQPVSYKIASRSGDQSAFASMVDRCNRAGVRVIVDLVLNHMTGELDGVGTGGSPFQGQTGKSYPGVPFDASHFNSMEKCNSGDGLIHDYGNPAQVRNCELSGLHDLDTSNEYVRSKQRDAINSLIDVGVAGFRLDASKHMWPEDIKAVFDGVHDLNTAYFPSGSRPIIYHEVMPGGSVSMAEYTPLGRVLEFNYRSSIRDVFQSYGQQLKWLVNFGEGWSFTKSADAVPMVDNHDLQRSEPTRGCNFRSPRCYKLATAFMLAWPYGLPNVMSSYDWDISLDGDNDRNKFMGPPVDGQQNIQHVIRKDGGCEAPWVCEHRFKHIANMVTFRAVAGDEPVANWFDNGNNLIAFSRGSKAFMVINNEHTTIKSTFQTGLPQGTYCDIINGSGTGGQCTGKTINVAADGTAEIEIEGEIDVPMVAIHINPTSSSQQPVYQPNPTPVVTPIVTPVQPSNPSTIGQPSISSDDQKTLDHCALCVKSLNQRNVEL